MWDAIKLIAIHLLFISTCVFHFKYSSKALLTPRDANIINLLAYMAPLLMVVLSYYVGFRHGVDMRS